jgi:apolipoprotein D and lipocalin family protein
MKAKNLIFKSLAGIIGLFSFSSCVSIPRGATAVTPFDPGKYLGKWYEIARMDFKFERNLNQTTANYSLNTDGSIKVLNRGYNYKTGKWSEATGKARLAGNSNVARLKVSFFGPFYSGYNVIAMDPGYKYALVAGNNLNYLWILSRTKTLPEDVKQNYIKLANGLGFNTNALIWVEQGK